MLNIILSVCNFSDSQQSLVKFGLHERCWSPSSVISLQTLLQDTCQNWYMCKLATEILAQSWTDPTPSQNHTNCSKFIANI